MSRDGEEWSAEPMPAPDADAFGAPQVAIDGRRVHIAYTPLEPVFDTCSPDPYMPLGVQVRSRELPDGEWAKPLALGMAGDALQSFRVVGGVIYATVTPAAGDTTGAVLVRYEDGESTRVEIPDASGTSLRVGDDGRARIAYSTEGAIRVGTIDGDELASEVVAKSQHALFDSPTLVLAPGDVASLVWTQYIVADAGCGGEDRDTQGTWFATDAGGSWAVGKASDVIGQTSLTIDNARGEAHVLVASDEGIRHLVRNGAGEWSSDLLPGTGVNPVIRVDPASDALVAFVLTDGAIRTYTQP